MMDSPPSWFHSVRCKEIHSEVNVNRTQTSNGRFDFHAGLWRRSSCMSTKRKERIRTRNAASLPPRSEEDLVFCLCDGADFLVRVLAN